MESPNDTATPATPAEPAAAPRVRCKFRCISRTEHENKTFDVHFVPVTNGNDENKRYWRWTPGGELSIRTVNERAAFAFEVGKDYYLDFTPAPAQ